MILIIAIIIVITGLICWVGQTLGIFAYPISVKLGLFEPKDDLDHSMYLFERFSQGIMDFLLTWVLPLSALLMIFEISYWPYFALIGGGIYLYFPGLFMITRIVLKKHDKKIGKRSSVLAAYVFGWIWIASAITMIVFAIIELQNRMTI